jgi:hypothetical protein
MQFSENVLSRNKMKAVRGGNEEESGEGGACLGTYYTTLQK